MLSREERAEFEDMVGSPISITHETSEGFTYKLEPTVIPTVTEEMRSLYFKAHGTYASETTIREWYQSLPGETHNTAYDTAIEALTTRGDGGSTSYYTLPTNATELGHLIRHKNMSHAIGEAFCALYRLDDNGERKRNLNKAKYYIEQELLYS